MRLSPLDDRRHNALPFAFLPECLRSLEAAAVNKDHFNPYSCRKRYEQAEATYTRAIDTLAEANTKGARACRPL